MKRFKFFKTTIVALGITLSVAGYANQQSNTDTISLYNQALESIDSKDFTKVENNLKSLTKLAEKGDMTAQDALGYLYEYGGKNNPFYNIELSLSWYEKAAKQGSSFAQRGLGIIYTQASKNTPKFFKEGVYWLEKAAAQGDVLSMEWLGEQYFYKKDGKKSVYWFQKAEELGSKPARRYLIDLYKGIYNTKAKTIVKKDIKKALYWLEKGAEEGYWGYQIDLVKIYLEGKEIPKDVKKGKYWLSKLCVTESKPKVCNTYKELL